MSRMTVTCTWMILPGMGETMLPATSAAGPDLDHFLGVAVLKSYASPCNHKLMTCKCDMLSSTNIIIVVHVSCVKKLQLPVMGACCRLHVVGAEDSSTTQLIDQKQHP